MGGISQFPHEESQSEHWQKATNIIWIIHIESTWYMDGDQQYDWYMDGDNNKICFLASNWWWKQIGDGATLIIIFVVVL